MSPLFHTFAGPTDADRIDAVAVTTTLTTISNSGGGWNNVICVAIDW